MDLNTLNKAALAAAMRGGTDGWGQCGSAAENVRYAQPVRPRSRRRCHCGCGQRATHLGMANGVGLTTACELAVRRWIKTGHTKALAVPVPRLAAPDGVIAGTTEWTKEGIPLPAPPAEAPKEQQP